MNDRQKLSVVILAAGRSLRMGVPKLRLPFDDKHTFLEAITERYLDFGCLDIAVVVNQENRQEIDAGKLDSSIKIIVNKHPEWQRFYSVQLGLQLTNPDDPVFIHNIDNPFVDKVLLQKMAESLSSDKYVVPVYRGRGGHPVLLSPSILKAILQTTGHSSNLKTFLKSYQRINIETSNPGILININTREDYRKFTQLP